jgi:hypothetical protein
MGQTAAAAATAAAVSPFLAWIGSPCLRRCVHGVSTGGGARRTQPGVRAERLALAPKGAGRGKGKGRGASREQLGDGSTGAPPIETHMRVRVEIMGSPKCRTPKGISVSSYADRPHSLHPHPPVSVDL